MSGRWPALVVACAAVLGPWPAAAEDCANPKPWVCPERAPLPCGGPWKSAVATLPRGADAATAVERAARAKLLGPLCDGARSCAALEANVSLYPNAVAQGGDQVCAQVVLSEAALDRWRRTKASTEGLAAQLDERARDLLPAGKPSPRKPHRVAVGAVRRGHLQGAERGVWLAQLIAAALSRAGAEVVPLKPGEDKPSGVEWVIEGTYVNRRENNSPVVDVQYSARPTRAGSTRWAPALLIPEDAAPSEHAAPTVAAGALSMRLAPGPHGRLCNGDRTTLKVSAPGAGTLYVFDRFADHALTLPPQTAYGPQDLSSPALDIAPPPGGEPESLVAVFVPRGKPAGWLAGLPKGQCRLSATQRARLDRGEWPAGAQVGTSAFVVHDGPPCAPGRALSRAQVGGMIAGVVGCE